MKSVLAASAAVLGLATNAAATELRLPIPGSAPVEKIEAAYDCGAKGKLSATYVNSGPNTLALVPVDGQTLVFVTVLSGSGARYASGPWIWWTKGSTATLTDERKPNASPVMQCKQIGG
jgi:membrane-bound inhibitor of C-type lysozyme